MRSWKTGIARLDGTKREESCGKRNEMKRRSFYYGRGGLHGRCRTRRDYRNGLGLIFGMMRTRSGPLEGVTILVLGMISEMSFWGLSRDSRKRNGMRGLPGTQTPRKNLRLTLEEKQW
jgi:hypothetical protein